ncbi:2-haloalkanoic acid dehalogenase [Vanrija pseudolonga]|uniref:2-haloalkanoic acid dehalogenase n=1 Tax=Vanrija pseudolonga TaxID=143232 RepID=A0AAF0YIM8_9TREE|nr:2-haloalkanoic acid dehalogenase [Vanrija pseudolonga]
MPPAAILFDAYGTLFDVYAVTALAEAHFPASGESLAQLWRLKQIEYTQLRTLADPDRRGHYKPFYDITLDALRFCANKLGLALSAQAESELMGVYERLDAHPDVLGTLTELKKRGIPMAILSNGNPAMLETMVAANGLTGIFDDILSVDTVRAYKPHPASYTLGTDKYGAKAADIVFVSSNGWDAAGATWFGYNTFWCNRAGLPLEQLDATPKRIGKGLADLAHYLDELK